MRKASKFLKDLYSAIAAAVKARSTTVRAKTSAMRTRLIIFGILRNRKLLLSAINRKIHAIMGGSQDGAYGEPVVAGQRDGGEERLNAHRHFFAAGAGGRKGAVVLQNLPSFVLEQEKGAVVLLSSLPSFAMDRDGGEQQLAGEVEEDVEGSKRQQLAVNAAAPQAAVSVIELARVAAEDGGAEFRLEDEIDHVADVFIRRFHDQMKLQKLESFKRFCEMLERGTS